MKATKSIGGDEERRILTGLIVDRQVLAQVAARWEGELFRSQWSNLIGSWCVKFFQRYNKAPKVAIEGLFQEWAEHSKNKEVVSLVEKFLVGLSGEYEQLTKDSNSEYTLDLAAKHFNRVKMQRLVEAVQGDLEDGNPQEAEKRITSFGRVEIGVGTGVDVLKDQEAIKQAFADKRDPLVKYPGALGEFFGDALERDAFVAFMGAEKRGKTWWLLDLAWRAMQQGRKVAFFEVGDMSQNQIMRRLMVRASKHPLRPGKMMWPTFIERDGDQPTATVTLEEYEFTKPLNWKLAWKNCNTMMKKCGSNLRLSCHPNSSINVAGLRSTLQAWERASNWTPDVVVIDYADILAPPTGVAESRDQINATWKQLRGLSQSLHCLVATATQADAASYHVETLDRSNFSEDKRKLAHCTGMVGLNSTSQEKEQGIMRLNWVVLRESEFHDDLCVHVAGCLGLGAPAIKSTF